MIRVYCGTPYPIAEGNAGGVAEYVASCADMGVPVTWTADTPQEDDAVTEILCRATGTPCRTAQERDIESHGGSPDRPTLMFGDSVYPPADYLD